MYDSIFGMLVNYQGNVGILFVHEAGFMVKLLTSSSRSDRLLTLKRQVLNRKTGNLTPRAKIYLARKKLHWSGYKCAAFQMCFKNGFGGILDLTS